MLNSYHRGIDEGDREDMEIGMREDRAEDQLREHNSDNVRAEGGLQSAGDMKRRRDLYTELLWDRFQSRPRRGRPRGSRGVQEGRRRLV
ncbi:hypothetical protein L198_01744 [Cryptococcus wingfieldii CBS 7118]|uniref:Uncharacterized protein n=1 Tax=Cryptococcus wingfieldii CBS 7118 TaxID=1295528 RepID=A0A1E3K0G0_9TREE|nr:hypothetical protein L198_01744 [Cryptococcus wingfieldii CBS 7118]ODO06511.1 hypothetical protein L198_01744 [Cryptococcus wingfieldii CBS 7118]